MNPGLLNLDMQRGLTFNPVAFNVKDENDNPINLSGWRVIANSRNGNGKTIDLGVVVTDAANGVASLSLTQNQTINFNTGEQQWDLIFQRPDGTKIGPYIAGKINVKDSVTHG